MHVSLVSNSGILVENARSLAPSAKTFLCFILEPYSPFGESSSLKRFSDKSTCKLIPREDWHYNAPEPLRSLWN